MNLSEQAIGALMMALQNSLLNQSDIVPVLKEFEFRKSDSGLMIMNPPLIKYDYEKVEEEKIEEIVNKQLENNN